VENPGLLYFIKNRKKLKQSADSYFEQNILNKIDSIQHEFVWDMTVNRKGELAESMKTIRIKHLLHSHKSL